MRVDKVLHQLDPDELMTLLVVLPAERCVHLLLQLSVLSDEEKLTDILKRLSDWETNEEEPLKALFSLPMGLNLLDYMFGEQYLPDTAPSGEMYWSYMFNGCRKAVDIIAQLGTSDSRRIAAQIQATEPELWSRIKEHVFLWEDICRLTDGEAALVMQELPGALQQDELFAVFLSSLEPAELGKLLGNLPQRRKDAVWDCLQSIGCDSWQQVMAPELYQRDIRSLVLKHIRAGRIQSPNAETLRH